MEGPRSSRLTRLSDDTRYFERRDVGRCSGKEIRPEAEIRMIAIERIAPQHLLTFKEIRLRALQTDPQAFGSTYAREAQFTFHDWLQRTARWNGESGIGYLAMEDGGACGLAGSLIDPEDPARAQLVSMWTAPTHRRRGVGRLLVEEVAAWARTRNARTLGLMVTSVNETAIPFYERLGFIRTGRTEPYPNDPALLEYEMIRHL